jgi:hypothetical protein
MAGVFDESSSTPSGEGLAALAALAPRDEVRQLAGLIRDDPIVRTLLDWLDGYVVVMNSQRQILFVSDSVARDFEREAECLVGVRPGDALGCLFADAAPAGCETSMSCRYCGLLDAVQQAAESGERVDGECRLTSASGTGELTRRFRVRVAPVRIGGHELLLALLQRPSQAPPALSAGAQAALPAALRRYALVRSLGGGGMGTVYLVSDGSGRQYALKTIRTSSTADPEARRRFERETEMTLTLDHPNIARTFEADCTSDGTFYMVSEYCPHGSLAAQLQRRGPLPVDAAIYWMIGAARGLDHAWSEHRVIHRDIKPDNLLVGEDLRLKIVDFGIARQSELAVDQLTTAGMIVGSVRYMSPEQAYHPTEVDNGADLYSLGATFYHLLAGVAPFEGPNPMQILVQHAEDPPVPLVLRRPNLLPDLGDCVGWLLAKQRSSRPASARELLDRLFRLAETVGVDPDSPPASVRSIVTGEPATPADAAARVAPATGPTKVQRPPH